MCYCRCGVEYKGKCFIVGVGLSIKVKPRADAYRQDDGVSKMKESDKVKMWQQDEEMKLRERRVLEEKEQQLRAMEVSDIDYCDARACTHIHTHKHTPANKHTHANTCTHAHTYTHNTCTFTRTFTRTYKNSHAIAKGDLQRIVFRLKI